MRVGSRSSCQLATGVQVPETSSADEELSAEVQSGGQLSAGELSAEDAKLVTLARGARGRIGAAEGAALRDETGRTYSAANVALPSLILSALQLAVAQAAAAGARGCECAVVVSTRPDVSAAELAAVSDLAALDGDSSDGPKVPVIACAPNGTITARLTAGPMTGSP